MWRGIWRVAGLALFLAGGLSHWAGLPSSAAAQQHEQAKPQVLKPDKDAQKMIAACRSAMAQARVIRLPGRDQPLLQVNFPYVGRDSDLTALTKALKESMIPIELNLKQGNRLTDDGLQHLGDLPKLLVLRLE